MNQTLQQIREAEIPQEELDRLPEGECALHNKPACCECWTRIILWGMRKKGNQTRSFKEGWL